MATKAHSFRIPEHLADRIDDYAKLNQRSRSSVIKEALMRWLEREDRLTPLSERAYADRE